MPSPLLAWLLPPLLPLGLCLWLVSRTRRLSSATPPARRSQALRLYISAALGALAGGIAVGLGGHLARSAGIHPGAQSLGDLVALLASIAVLAPLQESLKLLAFAPAYRSRWARGRLDAVLHAAVLGLGYATIDTAFYLRSASPSLLSATRAVLSVPVHVFAASMWAYALGRSRSLGLPAGRSVLFAWLLAVGLHGLYDHLLFGRGFATLLAVLPLLAAMALVAIVFGRALAAPSPVSSRARRLLPQLPPPPSIRAVRAALRRAERPATLRWIAFGSLVTTGTIITSVVLTVFLAQRLGIDFSAVDEGEVTSTFPLVLVGSAVLVAFPFAGYLLARASATDRILEPAMGAGLAIVTMLVALGVASPVTVVFGLAFAPVAFVLACAGAWMGASFSAS